MDEKQLVEREKERLEAGARALGTEIDLARIDHEGKTVLIVRKVDAQLLVRADSSDVYIDEAGQARMNMDIELLVPELVTVIEGDRVTRGSEENLKEILEIVTGAALAQYTEQVGKLAKEAARKADEKVGR